MCMKAKDLADQYEHTAMPADLVARMYELRDAAVSALASAAVISLADVLGLELTGRVLVASELFERCDGPARAQLLEDPHHFVRSAAQISMGKLGMLA